MYQTAAALPSGEVAKRAGEIATSDPETGYWSGKLAAFEPIVATTT